MPWFLLSPGISILDSGILFSIHPAATPNPESAENRLAAGVGRARRWVTRSTRSTRSRGTTRPCRHLLDSGFRQMAAIPESAKLFMTGLIERARKLKTTIAFPEGTDARGLEAAARLAREGVVKPVLIGARPANGPEGVEFVDPATSPLVKKYAALYYERRRAKGTIQVEAAAVAKKPLYFASLMVGAGDADGSVGGAVNSTAETVRAALHAVGVHPRARLVSSVFIMALQDRALGHN